jgi:hypothetical protein
MSSMPAHGDDGTGHRQLWLPCLHVVKIITNEIESFLLGFRYLLTISQVNFLITANEKVVSRKRVSILIFVFTDKEQRDEVVKACSQSPPSAANLMEEREN